MKVCVIGLGYIGLPTATMFALHGADVLGVDINEEVVNTVNKGKIHIEEPGLAEKVSQVVSKGKLRAALKPEKSDVFIITVPTPNKNDAFLSCDLKYVMEATQSIFPCLVKGNIVIIESTVEPRATDDYIKPLIESWGLKVGKDVYLAHCPERVLPGKVLEELVENNRLVGGITDKCAEKAAEVYKIFVKGEIIKTEAKTAEMSKLIENTYRDINIALANELVKICNHLSINALDVINLANKHPRVNIHSPGPGVGGHCIAVDPYFIHAKVPKIAKIIKLSRETNSSMPDFVVNNSEKLLNYDKKKKIAVLGITYKPDVNDTRQSPALEIIKKLKEAGYDVSIYDPHVNNSQNVTLKEALSKDLILILVAHKEFREMPLDNLENKIIFDTTGCIKGENIDNFVNYGNLYNYIKDL